MRKRTVVNLFRLTIALTLLTFYLGCRKEVDIQLNVDFDFIVADSNYNVPARISFTNKSKGAQFYKWTFVNGNPGTSDYKNPGYIVFNTPGPITVKLEAWNDRERKEKIIEIILDTIPKANFKTVPRINNISPAVWDFEFTGAGAAGYKWNFENGQPANSIDRNPSQISYTAPGSYRIHLEIKNQRGKWDTISKWITVLPPLSASFDIIPSFDDEDDYEAPLKATLSNHSISATTHTWDAAGGVINNSSDSITVVNFSNPGNYTVNYTAGNGKQTQTVSKTITVKPNKGMRTFKDVHLGINTAHGSIGSFFSTYLRKVIKKDSVNALNGPQIDICFFGLSEHFSFNKFLIPTDVQNWTFQAIPNARSTTLINKQETCNCSSGLSPTQFDAIANGSFFNGIQVPSTANGLSEFDGNTVPRVVLFENANGKKGAIKIKQFVSQGTASYIICDIKVQKD